MKDLFLFIAVFRISFKFCLFANINLLVFFIFALDIKHDNLLCALFAFNEGRKKTRTLFRFARIRTSCAFFLHNLALFLSLCSLFLLSRSFCTFKTNSFSSFANLRFAFYCMDGIVSLLNTKQYSFFRV